MLAIGLIMLAFAAGGTWLGVLCFDCAAQRFTIAWAAALSVVITSALFIVANPSGADLLTTTLSFYFALILVLTGAIAGTAIAAPGQIETAQ